jgi:hypothetical protein
VDGATVTRSFVSSPWIRRCPHSGFSLARRTTRRAMPGTVSGAPWPAPPARVVLLRRQPAVPGQQRRRRHGEELGPAPARYKPRQRGEPGPVGRLVPHPAGVPPQDRVLVSERQQLSILRQVTAEDQDGHAEHPARKQVHDLEQHPPSQPSPRLACLRKRGQPLNRVVERHRFGHGGWRIADSRLLYVFTVGPRYVILVRTRANVAEVVV